MSENNNKVVLSLQKIKSKNLGQNKENLVNYLVKDYNSSIDEAEILINEAVTANTIKTVIYKGKTSYRIMDASFVSDATILVPETQEEEEDVREKDTVVLDETEFSVMKDSSTETILNQDEDITAIIERKFSILNDNIERRLHKIEDQIIGMQSSNLPGSKVGCEVDTERFLCVDILKNRILDLEKQLSEKNAIINFLNTQLIGKSQKASYSNLSHNNGNQKEINSDKDNDSPCDGNGIEKKSKKVVIIGDSMLNNINSRGLSKSKEVDVLNFSGATSADIVSKIDDVLNKKPASLIVHVGTNDLTNDVNLLTNAKKIVNKVNQTSPNTVLTFSNIIVRKDKKNLEKTRADTNSRLKNFCRQKEINLISNDNIKEDHLGIKKLHLNRKGNSVFAKNLLNYIEGN